MKPEEDQKKRDSLFRIQRLRFIPIMGFVFLIFLGQFSTQVNGSQGDRQPPPPLSSSHRGEGVSSNPFSSTGAEDFDSKVPGPLLLQEALLPIGTEIEVDEEKIQRDRSYDFIFPGRPQGKTEGERQLSIRRSAPGWVNDIKIISFTPEVISQLGISPQAAQEEIRRLNGLGLKISLRSLDLDLDLDQNALDAENRGEERGQRRSGFSGQANRSGTILNKDSKKEKNWRQIGFWIERLRIILPLSWEGSAWAGYGDRSQRRRYRTRVPTLVYAAIPSTSFPYAERGVRRQDGRIEAYWRSLIRWADPWGQSCLNPSSLSTKEIQDYFLGERGERFNRALNFLGMSSPLSGRGIRSTSYIGKARLEGRHPHSHEGYDLATASGTPLYAVQDGVVLSSGRESEMGNFLEIQIRGALPPMRVVRYLHMRDRPQFRRGDRVVRGQFLGRVGSTGVVSSGPHLHIDFYNKPKGSGGHPIDLVQLVASRLQYFDDGQWLTREGRMAQGYCPLPSKRGRPPSPSDIDNFDRSADTQEPQGLPVEGTEEEEPGSGEGSNPGAVS